MRSYPTEERGLPPLVLRGEQRTRDGPTLERTVKRSCEVFLLEDAPIRLPIPATAIPIPMRALDHRLYEHSDSIYRTCRTNEPEFRKITGKDGHDG